MENRLNCKGVNNNGEEMVIIKYINSKNIDVYFPKYNYINKNKTFPNFKKGNIRCPYTKNVYGVGYLGDGEYKTKENGKITRVYDVWRNMIRRCYSKEDKKSFMSYKAVTVCEEWHNFQNFAKWYEENYYEVDGERTELDKDILIKGSKIYSPETCCFVTSGINNIFTKSNKIRGVYPIGVTCDSNNGKFISTCKTNRESDYLGYFDTVEEAFSTYKQAKEEYIKQVADEYKDRIPKRLYDALYKYKVDITD